MSPFTNLTAGGSGTRLWPLSRQARPKQALRLVGDRTMSTKIMMMFHEGDWRCGLGKVYRRWQAYFDPYNPAIYETADVVATYVYRRGIEGFDYSFATAVGLVLHGYNLSLEGGGTKDRQKGFWTRFKDWFSEG